MPGKHRRYVNQRALRNICDYVLDVLWKRQRGQSRLRNLFKKNMRIGIVAYRHLEPVLGIHSNATDGRDHGIALSPGSGRVRKLCLLPHHRVLRLELVLFVPGRVFAVCLCILAMYRPGVRQQQPSLELLVFHAALHLRIFVREFQRHYSAVVRSEFNSIFLKRTRVYIFPADCLVLIGVSYCFTPHVLIPERPRLQRSSRGARDWFATGQNIYCVLHMPLLAVWRQSPGV